jgi:glucosamine-6-phosphate deaminase
VLGLPTGRTPVPLYHELVRLHGAGRADFRHAATFNLDEFVAVPPHDPTSYHAFMRRHLFDHVNLSRRRIHFLNGAARDVARECDRYERAIVRAGGIDVQILGLGANGHIGFNEPGSDFSSRTREIRLDEATRLGNAGNFPDAATAPERAITMGIATILEARSILLLATGTEKATAIAAAIEGPLTPACPASALRLHGDVHILCDQAAASALHHRPNNGVRRTA